MNPLPDTNPHRSWQCPHCETQNLPALKECEVCGRERTRTLETLVAGEEVPRFGTFSPSGLPVHLEAKPDEPAESAEPEEKGAKKKDNHMGIFSISLGMIIVVILLFFALANDVSYGYLIMAAMAVAVTFLLVIGLQMASKDKKEDEPVFESRLLPKPGNESQLTLSGGRVHRLHNGHQLESWDLGLEERYRNLDLRGDEATLWRLSGGHLLECRAGEETSTLYVFELNDTKVKALLKQTYRSTLLPADVQVSAGQRILVLKRDGEMLSFKWQGEDAKHASSLPDPEDRRTCVALSADGRQVAVGHEDGSVRLLKAANLFLEKRLAADCVLPVRQMVYAPFGDWLVAVHDGGNISLHYLLVSHPVLGRSLMVGANPLQVVFDPAGATLLLLLPERILLLDPFTRKLLAVIGTEGKSLVSATFSPEGHLIGLSRDGALHRLDVPIYAS